jgi:hypothetical protein
MGETLEEMKRAAVSKRGRGLSAGQVGFVSVEMT